MQVKCWVDFYSLTGGTDVNVCWDQPWTWAAQQSLPPQRGFLYKERSGCFPISLDLEMLKCELFRTSKTILSWVAFIPAWVPKSFLFHEWKLSQNNQTNISRFLTGGNPLVGQLQSHQWRHCCQWCLLFVLPTTCTGQLMTSGDAHQVPCIHQLFELSSEDNWGESWWHQGENLIKSEILYEIFILLMHFFLFLPQLFCILCPEHWLPLPLFFTGLLPSVSDHLSQTEHKLNKI